MIDVDRFRAINWVATLAIVGVLFLLSFALGWRLAVQNALSHSNSDGEVAVQMEQDQYGGMETTSVVEISDLAIPGWVTLIGGALAVMFVVSIGAAVWILRDEGEFDIEKALG